MRQESGRSAAGSSRQEDTASRLKSKKAAAQVEATESESSRSRSRRGFPGLGQAQVEQMIQDALEDFRDEAAELIEEQVQSALGGGVADLEQFKDVQTQVDFLTSELESLQQATEKTQPLLEEKGSVQEAESKLQAAAEKRMQDFASEQVASLTSFRDMVETELRKRNRKENDFTV